MNKVILAGRLVKDPDVKYSQNVEPTAITRFSIAVNRKFKKEGEADVDFIACVSFGSLAEFIGKYFTKGKMIGIVGSIRVNSWTTDNGEKRSSYEIIVSEAEFLEKKENSESKDTENID
ncbi:single-stranded DNA-binding protein [uncultured Tyzzerella sp.]|uniref:single-stranded DNA-binding protein n=1 Tax=uncultured Tyzzerella sp. TaxID=2321398 RepID=UPI0029435707|nr:single-stranded DNA-binding protein [uncultured Tyzzerella sp.]